MADRAISKKDYCSKVCSAKCCHAYFNDIPVQPCPNLNEHNLCSIYKERYEEGKPYSFAKVLAYQNKLVVLKSDCGNIKDLLKTNKLPDSIKKQCCYHNPELLKVHYED